MTTNPSDIVNMIYTDLVSWAATKRGVVALTNSPYDLLEMLAQRPNGWRLTIHWEGDLPAGNTSARDVRVVDNRIRFILDGDLGPTFVPKIALIRPTAARTPFLELVGAIRARVMAYRFDWLAEPNNRLRYTGTDDKVQLPDGFALAAYNLSFNLFSEIDNSATIINLTMETQDEEESL